MSLKTIESRVMALLERNPLLRSCDKLLISTYMLEYHKCETLKEYALRAPKLPAFETITRTRRLIQASGLFPATEETKRLRAEATTEFMSYSRSEPRQGDLFGGLS